MRTGEDVPGARAFRAVANIMLASMVGIILAAVWQRIYEGWRESRAQARRAEDQARIIRECQEEIKRIRAREIQMQEQIRRAKEGEKR